MKISKYCALLFCTTLLCAAQAKANPVSEEQAREKANRFWGTSTETRSGDATLAYEAEDALYVFNNTASDGFVVIAADDSRPEILGWSDSGHFDPNDIPDGLRWWIEMQRIATSEANRQEVAPAASYRDSWTAVAPLLKTQWNQRDPYNMLCPSIGGQKCLTGCVATALGQVMKYFEWPKKGTGSYSYEWNDQTLSIDLTQVNFDWANMLNTYTGSANATQKNAVAKLMQCCGYITDMEYGVTESGGHFELIEKNLYDLMGYKSHYVNCADYANLQELETVVYGEMSAKRPLLLMGWGNDGGHAFVIDGYSKDGLFHVNWGWSGTSDGYFMLNKLNPPSYPDGFNSEQYMVYGFEKFENVVCDGVYYELKDGKATAIRPVNGLYTGTLVIPAEITVAGTTYPVGAIDPGVLTYHTLREVTNLEIQAPVIERIEDDALRQSKLISVILPSSVKEIGDNAFNQAPNLKSVTIPNVETIGESAFYGCRNLTDLNLGNSIKTIKAFAFYQCESLSEFDVPEAVTLIEMSTFRKCSSLKEIKLGSNVEEIGNYAFDDDSELERVVTGNRLRSIGQEAFGGCSALKEVVLGEELTTIGMRAFASSYNLERVDCHAFEPPVCDGYVFNQENSPVLHVPKGRKSIYATAPEWEEFTTIISDLGEGPDDEDEDGVESIISDSTVTVYTTDGKLLLKDAPTAALRNLPAGVYIINHILTHLR